MLERLTPGDRKIVPEQATEQRMPYRPLRHRPPRIKAAGNRPRRESAAARGCGRRWERLTRMFRRRNPLCTDPFGIHAADGVVVPSEQVDHIVPRSAGGTDDWSNMQALSTSCHSRKTVLCDGGFGRAKPPPPGGMDSPAGRDVDRAGQAQLFRSRVLL